MIIITVKWKEGNELFHCYYGNECIRNAYKSISVTKAIAHINGWLSGFCDGFFVFSTVLEQL